MARLLNLVLDAEQGGYLLAALLSIVNPSTFERELIAHLTDFVTEGNSFHSVHVDQLSIMDAALNRAAREE